MKVRQLRRWSSGLALQVSPCITLGLLLVASLSARAAGLPGDISACLQRVSSQAEQSATMLGAADGHERLQFFAPAQAAIASAVFKLSTPVSSQAFTFDLQAAANSPSLAAAQPRAP